MRAMRRTLASAVADTQYLGSTYATMRPLQDVASGAHCGSVLYVSSSGGAP